MDNSLQRELIIAIDGPSGVGKSTLSKLLARQFGYLNLDTGAMYRTVALAATRKGVNAEDRAALNELCRDIEIGFDRSSQVEHVMLNGVDVSQAIRTPEISLLTAKVAACSEVRQAMVERQREFGRLGGIVLEGRDIGTVVFPEAEVKFFLKASAAERGRRRYLELLEKGMAVDLDQTIAEVEARDDADTNRLVSPLRQAEDAHLVDTSLLTIEEVLAQMTTVVAQRREALGLAGGV
jgi:cytidylate kinase